MGLIYWWARLAALVPDLASLFSQTPGLRTIAKAIAGVAPERDLPEFASQTFNSGSGSVSRAITAAPK